MKTSTIIFAFSLICLSISGQTKEKITVLNADVRGIEFDKNTLANMIRVELEKTGNFDVTDRYEVQQFLADKKISMDNCFGKTCLTEVGKLLGSDKMFGASVEFVGKNLVFTYRVINVAKGDVEKIYVHEFLNLPSEIQTMVKYSVAEMFGMPFDKNIMNKLSKPNEFESATNLPGAPVMKLDGPRMGFVGYSGELARKMAAPKSKGGFDSYPVMFQFGYQFEKRYLNEGNAQALFEFIPMVTGLDQGKFIPSLTILNGLRSNVNGWEFAFGPTFNIIKSSKGYYDNYGDWHLEAEYKGEVQNKPEIVDRVDSRGTPAIRSSLVITAGKTFRSGKLNIPVNIFVVPGNAGWRFGISMGFNARKSE